MADENVVQNPSEGNNPSDRPMKTFRGAARTSKLARPTVGTSKSLLPAKRPTATRKPQAIEDDVFLTRQVETVVEEPEVAEEAEDLNQARKKRARVEEAKPAKDAGWEDLDLGDEDDPLMVSEYVKEVYEYLLEKEVR